LIQAIQAEISKAKDKEAMMEIIYKSPDVMQRALKIHAKMCLYMRAKK